MIRPGWQSSKREPGSAKSLAARFVTRNDAGVARPHAQGSHSADLASRISALDELLPPSISGAEADGPAAISRITRKADVFARGRPRCRSLTLPLVGRLPLR